MGKRESPLESMVNSSFWEGKKVLLTGHTGFKGSWLSLWLHQMGADVFGYSLEPDTSPSLFHQLDLHNKVDHTISDIRDAEAVKRSVLRAQPDVVFHMAAQPLVLRSYREPAYTWEVNVMGSIHLMEALRDYRKPCSVVMVTTDKVYENREEDYAYRETDRLGGLDPYSSGKAAAELAVHSWRESYFKSDNNIRIATARAGNVIGGGDWSENRIVPDLIRALSRDETVEIRNPHAVRPWQHVLEPLSGYLVLAQALYHDRDNTLQQPFNFGPLQKNSTSVMELVQEALIHWPGSWKDVSNPTAPHEAGLLSVHIGKAERELGWKPRWDFNECVSKTVQWYHKQIHGEDAADLCIKQINEYTQA